MRSVWREDFPIIHSSRVSMTEGDLLPKPRHSSIPLLITGHSSQSIDWIAQNGDGFTTQEILVNSMNEYVSGVP